MTTITLTSDFGESEIYTAALKGELLSNCEKITIIDISHKIRRNNIAQAAFMMRCTYLFFPSKTIHFILVGDFENKNNYWVAKVDEHFFITKNFTTISLLFSSTEKKIMITQINNVKYFQLVQTLMQKEQTVLFDATLFQEKSKNTFPQPILTQQNSETKIRGNILYFTANGDAMTNISQVFFNQIHQPLKIIYINSNEHCIYEISDEEQKIQDGKLYAKFNIYGLLEISMKNTSIRQFLGLELISSTVTLVF